RWSRVVSFAVCLGLVRFAWGAEPPAAIAPRGKSAIRTAAHSARPDASLQGNGIRQIAGAQSPQAPPADDDTPDDRGTSIDLTAALRLAGVENLELVIARQRVEVAVAIQQLAAAPILPAIHLRTDYDAHTRNLP